MTLVNFPPADPTVQMHRTPSTPRGTSQAVTTTTQAVSQTVTVTPVASRSDLLAEPAEWTWSELRDYVVAQIEAVSGPFPRDARKEYGIFNRFLNTYGAEGIRVARYAFEVCGGWWNGAPISINRFTKGSDAFFVIPILTKLAEA